MTILYKNNAATTLSGSINNSQTSITVVNSGPFPAPAGSDFFYATMYETSGGSEINVEIVKVTAVSGNVWTIVRAQDGTTARSRDGIATCYIENRFNAAAAEEALQKANNLSDVSSASTARTNLGLGSMATQAASAVAITGGTISGVSIETLDSSTTIADNTDPTKKVAFEVSGVGAGVTRTLTVPNASGTIALTSDLTSGYQPLDSDLTAIAGLSANGLIARTGTGTVAVRAVTQPAAGITVTNGDGVSGNPTLALANDLAAVEALSTTGFVRRTASDTWSASALVDADIPGALTGKTYNGVTLTSLPTIGFSVAGGTTSKTLTVNKTLTLDGTDGTTITFPATSGTIPLNNQTFFIGTTSVAINRASASLSLTGVNIDGSAGSASTATSATTATHLAGGTANQIAYQTGAGATSFVTAPSVSSTFLQWNGSAFVWSSAASGTVTSVAVSSSDLTVTGSPITTSGTISLALNTVPISKGGTGATTALAAFDALSPATTLGDLIYSDGTDNVRLAGNTTTSRRFLRQTGTGTVSAAPAWDALVDGDIPTALTGKTYNALTLTAATNGFTIAGGTNSKTLTVSNTLTFSGTDGSTLNVGSGGTLGSAAYTASTAYAPSTGSTSIVTLGTVATGTWQGSAIGITYGGTGQATKAAGFNALSPVTTLGDIIYGDGSNSNTRLAGNTTTSKRFLTQTGTGTVSAAPGWNAIVDADVPSALTGKTYNGLTLTANATGFQIAGGTTSKTLVVSNNLTFSGTDGSTLNIGAGGTLGTGAYATIANYALLASPTFTGTPAAPTAAVDTNTTQIATTAYVVGQGYLKSATASSTYQTISGMSSYLTTATASSIYAPLASPTFTGTATTPNLAFNTAAGRITGDFSNATNSNRVSFQTSTTNSTTAIPALPSGTGAAAYYVVHNGSDANNSGYAFLGITSTAAFLDTNRGGTGTAVPLVMRTSGVDRATFGLLGGFDVATGLRETKVTMAASDIDLRTGNYFTRTISTTTTLTVSNVPAAGTAASFILDLTNGGSGTINWWSGMKWAGGTAPTLTAAGRDVLGFFTHDGGTTWTGLVLGKDVK